MEVIYLIIYGRRKYVAIHKATSENYVMELTCQEIIDSLT